MFELNELLEGRGAFLITGASGFLGSRMRRVLESYGQKTIPLSSSDCDLRCRRSTLSMFEKLRPDVVVHCAVQGGGIGWMKAHPVESGEDNIRINVNALEASWRAGARHFIGVSSACVYPKFGQIPFVEEDIWNGAPEPLNMSYALSKRFMMELGRAYAQQYGFHATFPILANLYGPGDHLQPERAHVIADLMIRAAQHPKKLMVWGTGKAKREFLHVQDAVCGVLAMLNAPASACINIGSGEEVSILDLAAEIVTSFNLDIPIELDSTKPDGQLRKVMSVDKAERLLSWKAQIGLKEGLKETAQWYSSLV